MLVWLTLCDYHVSICFWLCCLVAVLGGLSHLSSLLDIELGTVATVEATWSEEILIFLCLAGELCHCLRHLLSKSSCFERLDVCDSINASSLLQWNFHIIHLLSLSIEWNLGKISKVHMLNVVSCSLQMLSSPNFIIRSIMKILSRLVDIYLWALNWGGNVLAAHDFMFVNSRLGFKLDYLVYRFFYYLRTGFLDRAGGLLKIKIWEIHELGDTL